MATSHLELYYTSVLLSHLLLLRSLTMLSRGAGIHGDVKCVYSGQLFAARPARHKALVNNRNDGSISKLHSLLMAL